MSTNCSFLFCLKRTCSCPTAKREIVARQVGFSVQSRRAQCLYLYRRCSSVVEQSNSLVSSRFHRSKLTRKLQHHIYGSRHLSHGKRCSTLILQFLHSTRRLRLSRINLLHFKVDSSNHIASPSTIHQLPRLGELVSWIVENRILQ